jgi:type II secretory pathway component PulJ|tara:strand:- start:629 stop:1486 length:858 start_codon:yes stop_codon:yes gene_type:complete
MKKKLSSIAGVTLIEILIGILISVIMMAAMFASYSVVNSTYTQVTDRAKISQTGRDVIGMMIRDIRIAGYKYFNDNIQTTNEHSPIIITKSTNFNTECDKIDIVYGDVDYKASGSPKYTYERYKITYKCNRSTIPNKNALPLTGGGFPPIDAFAIYKSKVKWDVSTNSWSDPATDGNDETYPEQLIVDYIQDLIFSPTDEKGERIDPPPTPTNSTKDKLYSIKTVDIALTVRSQKDFFRSSKLRKFFALSDSTRDGSGTNTKSRTDKFLRETIVISAHVRNLGLQ